MSQIQIVEAVDVANDPLEIPHLIGSLALDGYLTDRTNDYLEEIRQQHESFLTELEALAVQAIATNDWSDFYELLVNFQSENDIHGVTGVAIDE
jgi:hypothetical protein